MEVTSNVPVEDGQVWSGGNKPLNASYGKMMMWFFIVSDALTFTGFLVSYGFSRFKNINSWPIADEVFTHFPFLHGIDAPMYYVALMTFILIFSSVTMVLAVDAGHKMQKNKVAWYMFATIIGGLIFVGSQAWEWNTFIKGSYGAVKTTDGKILQFATPKLDDSGNKIVNSEGEVVFKQIALSEFVTGNRMDEKVQHTRKNGLWWQSGNTLTEYSVAQVWAVDAVPAYGLQDSSACPPLQ